MRRWMPFAHAAVYAAVPLFPAFISLTSVAFPGISMVPAPIVLAVLAFVSLLAIYGAVALFRYRASTPAQPLLVPMLTGFAVGVFSRIGRIRSAAPVCSSSASSVSASFGTAPWCAFFTRSAT